MFQVLNLKLMPRLILIIYFNNIPANLIKSELAPPPSLTQSWGSALPPALSRVQVAPGFLH